MKCLFHHPKTSFYFQFLHRGSNQRSLKRARPSLYMEPEEASSRPNASVSLYFNTDITSTSLSSNLQFQLSATEHPNWSELLPSDLIRFQLVQFAWKIADICALRQVCKAWHAAVKLPYIIVDFDDLKPENAWILRHICSITAEIRVEVRHDEDEEQPSLQALFDASRETVQKIQVKRTKLSAENYDFLLDFLRRSTILRSLAAEDSDLFSSGRSPAQFFTHAVGKLSSLTLESSQVDENILEAFSEAIMTIPEAFIPLANIDFSGNHFRGLPLRFFDALRRLANLESIILDYNELSDEDYQALGSYLEQSHSLRRLSLNRTKTYGGVSHLGAALSINRSLLELRLQEATLTPACIAALGSALRDGAPLQILDLTACTLTHQDGANLSQDLVGNKSLRELHLGKNNFGPQGGLALAEALLDNTTLELLDLSFNKIGPNATAQLAQWLRKNQSLKQLFLDTCGVGSLGIRELGHMLHDNSTLKCLGLQRNGLTAKDVAPLAAALRINQSLRDLNLFLNKIGDEGVGALAEGLSKNQSLLHLDLAFNQLRDIAAKHLAEAYFMNLTLKEIEIHGNSFGFDSKDMLEAAWIWHLQHANAL